MSDATAEPDEGPPAPPSLSIGAVVGVRLAESDTALVDDVEIATGLALDHVRLTVPWSVAQPKPAAAPTAEPAGKPRKPKTKGQPDNQGGDDGD